MFIIVAHERVPNAVEKFDGRRRFGEGVCEVQLDAEEAVAVRRRPRRGAVRRRGRIVLVRPLNVDGELKPILVVLRVGARAGEGNVEERVGRNGGGGRTPIGRM